jgi:putative oxidoreductase
MKLVRTVARIVIGALFFGHGAQKLFGWFGGHGPEGTGQFFESALGLGPGKRNAIAAGASEAAGGAALAAGLLTPVAGAALTGTMLTAIRTAHLRNGIWVTDGGFEYNLVLIAAVLGIVEEESGPWVALAALAAGAAGSEAVIRTATTQPDQAAEAVQQETPTPEPATA